MSRAYLIFLPEYNIKLDITKYNSSTSSKYKLCKRNKVEELEYSLYAHFEQSMETIKYG